MGEISAHRAEREVLVCGGAYNSPQILTASGIGRSAELLALQIPVVAELPGVGMNLQDHANVWLRWNTDEPVTLWGALTEENMALFEAGTGPLTSNAAETGGFARSADHLRRRTFSSTSSPAPTRRTVPPPRTGSPPRYACSRREAADTCCTPEPIR